MLVKKTAHVRVRTERIARTEDMVRYIGYRGVEETSGPVRVDWAGSKVTVHRFTEDEFTYFRRPSCLNDNWTKNAIARWASFGVAAERVLR